MSKNPHAVALMSTTLREQQQEMSEHMRQLSEKAFRVGDKYGFGSTEHKAAMMSFDIAKEEYELFCRDNGIAAYATYNE